MLAVFRKMTVPYPFEGWLLDVINSIPKIIGGFFLTFYYSPKVMVVPWGSNFEGEAPFTVLPSFIQIVNDFGSIFNGFPEFFAYAAAYVMFFGGIALMVGCCTRLVSFLIFLVMVVTLFFRELDSTWSYIPTFMLLAVAILGMWFGSGKFGIDHVIAKKFNWR